MTHKNETRRERMYRPFFYNCTHEFYYSSCYSCFSLMVPKNERNVNVICLHDTLYRHCQCPFTWGHFKDIFIPSWKYVWWNRFWTEMPISKKIPCRILKETDHCFFKLSNTTPQSIFLVSLFTIEEIHTVLFFSVCFSAARAFPYKKKNYFHAF